MRKLLVLKKSSEENEKKIIDAASDEFEIVFSSRNEKNYMEKISAAEVIIGEPTAEELKYAVCLKWLQMTWAGVDIYTKSDWFPQDVILTNMSGAFGETISEYVIGAILSLYRGFPTYLRNQEKRLWEDAGSEKTLFGKNILILGAGDIGTNIAKRMKVFGTRNIGIQRTPRSMGDEYDEICSLKELDHLLSEADIVIGCLPETSETIGLLNEKRLMLMKKDALLINVGRGSLIVTRDLEKVLENGHLFGVALDVVDPEPLSENSKLWGIERVILTPHISGKGFGHDIRTEQKIYEIIAENLKRYVEGIPLRNVVDLTLGYQRNY